MLVLSRKIGERIFIGGEIELQVLSIRGGRVRLGINCPRDIPILRSELLPTVDGTLPGTTTVPTADLKRAAG